MAIKGGFLMVKKFGLLIFLTVLILLSLVGCTGGSYVITIGEIDSSKNHMSGDYNSFSGYYYKKVNLDDGESLSLTLSGVTENGELDAKVIDSDGNTVETLNIGDTANLDQPGDYKFQIEGKKHKGSFTLSWK